MDAYDKEPTAVDLAAIEADWPVVEAELDVLDAEIAALSAAGGATELDWRRLRHARRRLLATLAARRAASALTAGAADIGRHHDFGGAGVVTGRGARLEARFGMETIVGEPAYFMPAADGPRDGAA